MAYVCASCGVESAPCPDSVDEAEISRHFKNASESFFHEIEKELQKVNLFFGEKLNEAARRFTQLKNDVELQQKREAKQRQKSQQRKIQAKNEEKTNVGQNGNLRHRKTSAQTVTSPAKFLKIGSSNEDKSTVKTMKELKLAFTEFYLALVLIQNYQVNIFIITGADNCGCIRKLKIHSLGISGQKNPIDAYFSLVKKKSKMPRNSVPQFFPSYPNRGRPLYPNVGISQ